MRRRWGTTLMGGFLLLVCLAPSPIAQGGPWNDVKNLGPVGAVIVFILWDWRRGERDRQRVGEAMKLAQEALRQRDEAEDRAKALIVLVQNNTSAMQGLTDMLRQIPRFCPWNESPPGGPHQPATGG